MNETSVQEIHLSQRFLIVIEHAVRNTTRTLNDIFAILWRNSLINVHILSQTETDHWTLDTFMPYQGDCFTLDHLRIASFTSFNFTENLTLSMEQLYPEKLKDFNQCPLFIAPSLVDPFVIFRNTSGRRSQLTGIDVCIVSQISKTLNFRMVYSSPASHGLIFENLTVTGNLNLVCVQNVLLNFQS